MTVGSADGTGHQMDVTWRRRTLALAAGLTAATVIAAAAGPSIAAPTQVGRTDRPVAAPATPIRPTFALKHPAAAPRYSITGAVPGAQRRSLREVAATTAAASVSVTLDTRSIEQYWYFATGVLVTASGFRPNEPISITDTSPSGAKFTFDPAKADANGKVAVQVHPLGLYSEVGTHVLRVSGATSGLSGSASLLVIPDVARTLRVTVTPATVTRAQFRAKPITVRATGLTAYERVFFNLLGPDGSGQAVAPDDFLRADKFGVFTYQLQGSAFTVPTGLYTAGITGQNAAANYGQATFVITEGRVAAPIGSLTTASTRITQTRFGTNGLPIAVRGMPAFTAADLTLTTPTGFRTALGTLRADGDGDLGETLTGTGSIPTGVYTVRATSQTTGDYAETLFVVTDALGNFEPSPVIMGPRSLTAAQLTDPDGGFGMLLGRLTPSTSYNFTIYDSLSRFVPTRFGQFFDVTSDKNGTLSTRLSTRAAVPPGVYHVIVLGFDPPTNLRIDFTVTASQTGTAPTTRSTR